MPALSAAELAALQDRAEAFARRRAMPPIQRQVNRIESELSAYAWRQDRQHMMLPGHLDRHADYLVDLQTAARFQPASREHALIVAQALDKLEKSLPAASARRRYELKMADYLQYKVIPFYGQFDRTLADLPDKMRHCRDHGLVCVDASGDVKHRWPQKCNKSKLCAHEAREEGQRLSHRYLEPMSRYLAADKRAKLQYIVISPRNCPPDQLHDWKRRLMQTYSKLNRRAVSKAIVGSVVVQEDPIGADGNWNVHLNVLALVSGQFSWQAYRQAWLDELGADHVSIEFTTEEGMRRKTGAKLQRQAKAAGSPLTRVPTRHEILSSTFVELVKYITKISGEDHDPAAAPKSAAGDAETRADAHNAPLSQGDTHTRAPEAPPMYLWPPAMWWEWYQANRAFRRTRSYGVMYRVCDTCGAHDHSAADCPEVVLPDPDPQPVGVIAWRRSESRYGLFIDLIPAHNSTIGDAVPRPPGRDYGRGPP